MYCNRCGNSLPDRAVFCPACGASAGAAAGTSAAAAASPVAAGGGRVARHLNVLAILWLVLGLLRIFPGLVVMGFGSMAGGGWMMHSMGIPGLPAFAAGWMMIIGLFLMAFAVFSLLVAWGLYQRQSWGRILAIVIAIFSLFSPPFGTALGIYTLWVLAPEASGREWDQLSQRV